MDNEKASLLPQQLLEIATPEAVQAVAKQDGQEPKPGAWDAGKSDQCAWVT